MVWRPLGKLGKLTMRFVHMALVRCLRRIPDRRMQDSGMKTF